MKNILSLVFCLFAFSLMAQNDYVGTWKTVDDTDGATKSHFEIYEKDGKLYGKVVKLLEAATTDVCTDCPGDKNGKNLVGMELLMGLEKDGDYWSDGEIIDPADGKVYSCYIELEEKDKLKVRGYIGFSLLGRTQYWYRVN